MITTCRIKKYDRIDLLKMTPSMVDSTWCCMGDEVDVGSTMVKNIPYVVPVSMAIVMTRENCGLDYGPMNQMEH